MKVKEIMTGEPRTCSLDTNLAHAGSLMWNESCGILPIVEGGQLAGVVTDRDMFIALATRDTLAADLTVGDVASRDVATCRPDDDVRAALATMKQRRVRRLPVVDTAGALVGIVSIDDIVLASGASKDIRDKEVVDTFKAICAPGSLVRATTAA